MEILFERCAGLDVHQKTVVACVRVPKPSSKRGRIGSVRTFSTTTGGLLELASWLSEAGVTHVAMESTGVYWRPVYNILEGAFDLLLVNAQHVKSVPGRKTDVKDAEWLAQLLEHGLLKGSFVPPPPIRDLRDLTRFRKTLIQERSAHINRLGKTLELANIKLSAVASDIMGKSARAMIEALIEEQTDPQALARLAQGVLQKKHDSLVAALTGRVKPHHRFMLRQHLRVIDDLARAIEELDTRIEECMRPFAEASTVVQTMRGIGQRSAEALIAEIGADMTRFATAEHLTSWARICPSNRESAGKRLSSHIGQGNNWLKATLVEAAWAAVRCKGSYYGALYRRLKARRGAKRAVVAVAHAMLHAIWHMLTRRTSHVDLGDRYFDDVNRERLRRHHLRRLAQLGLTVAVQEGALT
jgi:transposase